MAQALTSLSLLICLIASSLSSSVLAQPPASVVLIIDDMGYSQALGERAIDLPGAINFAFLPHTPAGRSLAEQAHQQGKEVLLHAPMSNLHSKPLGPGALTTGMNQQQFSSTLDDALNSIPHVRGLNNHMGSQLTQLEQPMGWLMQELKQRQLYFVDSRTSPFTVAEAQAKSHQLQHLTRNVFLDNQRTPQAISHQFELLLNVANKTGLGVGIGHPYPETIAFLKQALPVLQLRGFHLALASDVLNKPTPPRFENPAPFPIVLALAACEQNLQNSLLEQAPPTHH